MSETTISAKDRILAFIDKYKLTMKTIFIPFSKSKHAKLLMDGKPWRSLNWTITLLRDGRDVITTDYAAGAGHCPSYKQGNNTIMRDAAIRWELENGKKVAWSNNLPVKMWAREYRTLGPILPDFCDVVSSLAWDASAIDSPTYEEWGPELGYDVDSSNGEAIYRQCIEIGLKIRAALGETGFTELREACQDY